MYVMGVYTAGPDGSAAPTLWQQATPERNAMGQFVLQGDIFVDVDTMDPSTHQPRWNYVPNYVASFGGLSEHHLTTGASSIYRATPTGFRVRAAVSSRPWHD
jgi:hypothetical protein